MATKAQIFNLALGVLLLQRRIVDTDNDPSNEAKVLNTHFDTAYKGGLADLDLDSTSTWVQLELLVNNPDTPYNMWLFAYKYPSSCLFFRRLFSGVNTDTRSTQVGKHIGIYQGKKVIFTNQQSARAEIITNDVPMSSLDELTALAIAYRLAILCAPLIVGKGAQKLVESIEKKYMVAKADAKAKDNRENFVFQDPDVESEFVQARME